jgi:hypothetical protein
VCRRSGCECRQCESNRNSLLGGINERRSPTRMVIKPLGSLGDMGGGLWREGGVGWWREWAGGARLGRQHETRQRLTFHQHRRKYFALSCNDGPAGRLRKEPPPPCWYGICSRTNSATAALTPGTPSKYHLGPCLIHTTPDSSHTPGPTNADSNVPHIPGAVENAGGFIRPNFGTSYARAWQGGLVEAVCLSRLRMGC